MPHVGGCAQRLGIDVGVPVAGVPGSCELTHTGIGNKHGSSGRAGGTLKC